MNQYQSNVTPMLLIFAAGFCAAPARVAAQTLFEQDFEDIGAVQPGQQGPSGLILEGWIFRNQSDPLGGTPAWTPNGGVGWPHGGDGYLSSSSTAAGTFGAKLSVWAILPDIPDLQTGDFFSLWVLDGAKPSTETFIDIRRSPTGGTDTGTGPFDVGDFTDVVFTGPLPLSGDGPYVYTQILQALSGPGRLAVRFHSPAISNFMSSATLYIDSLTIGEAPPDPCGLTFPTAGETVVWTAAGSPYTICQDFVIPQTATLIVEPGATLEFEPLRRLYVEGTFSAQGTEAQPVSVIGNNVSGFFVTGALSLTHADVTASVQLDPAGQATILDTTLAVDAWLSATDSNTALFMERCDVASLVFSGAGVAHYQDVAFSNPDASVSLGRIYKVDSVSAVAPIEYTLNCQTRLIENVSITGVDGPAITIGTAQTGTADVLLDESNSLIGNEYPIFIRTGGLHPESVVPASGNVNNAVLAPHTLGSASDLRSLATLPNLGVPYHLGEHATFNGRVDIPAGLLFLMAPEMSLNFRQNNGWHPQIRGLPGQPVRFERLDPARNWGSLGSTQGINLWEHLVIDGAARGVSAGESDIDLRDCEIHNCQIGAKPSGMGIIYATGNTFSANDIGVENDTTPAALFSGIKMDGAERPNVFTGNTLAASNHLTSSGQLSVDMHMERNWWGHETGPHDAVSNPTGQGDEVSPLVVYEPWELQPPDLANQRPVVRLKTKLHPVALTGEKIFLEWEAFDDQGITGFDIEVRTPPTFEDPPGWQTLASDLPPSTRRYELIVPDREPGAGKQVQFRILAHEATGQMGLEHFWLNIPDQPPPGTVEFLTDLTRGFLYDGKFTLCYTAFLTTGALPTLYIDLDGDMRTMREFGLTSGADECTSGFDRMPRSSTDTARFAIRDQGNYNNDYWYFSDYFEIRPDPRFDDAPPAVTITAPQPAAEFAGGSIIPIAWNAADDDFVRELRIQASLNGGYTYHTIADHVPGTESSYDWQLPASTGVPNLRIRVVAVDKRFQNSSDTVSVSVTPGSGLIPGDLDGDGDVDLADYEMFYDCFGGPASGVAPGCAEADLSGDGHVDLKDAATFQLRFSSF